MIQNSTIGMYTIATNQKDKEWEGGWEGSHACVVKYTELDIEGPVGIISASSHHIFSHTSFGYCSPSRDNNMYDIGGQIAT